MTKYYVEVLLCGGAKWCSNGKRFATHEEAVAYGADLFDRWTRITEYRICEESTDDDK